VKWQKDRMIDTNTRRILKILKHVVKVGNDVK